MIEKIKDNIKKIIAAVLSLFIITAGAVTYGDDIINIITPLDESYNVTWTLVKDGIINKEYIVTIKNNNPEKAYLPIACLFISNTSFNIDNLITTSICEQKFEEIGTVITEAEYNTIVYTAPNGTTQTIIERTIISEETVYSDVPYWKELTVKGKDKKDGACIEEVGIIKINKNKTTTLKVCFSTPIVETIDVNGKATYGSSGKVGILLDGEEFHPWWSDSWSYKVSSVVTDTNLTYGYVMDLNLSYGDGNNNETWVCTNGNNKTYFDDIRVTLDDTTELSYNFTDNTTENVVININVTDTGTISIYYGNAAATFVGDPYATYPFYMFEGDLTDWDQTSSWVGDKYNFASTGGTYAANTAAQTGMNYLLKSNMSASLGAFELSFSCYQGADSDEDWMLIGLSPSNDDPECYMVHNHVSHDGEISVRKNGYVKTAVASYDMGLAADGVWNTFRIIHFSSGLWQFWMNGTLLPLTTNTADTDHKSYNSVWFGFNGVGVSDNFIDNVILQNRRDPEPEWGAWGAEEARAPVSSLVSSNETEAGQTVLFQAYWIDETGLANYTFAWNDTGEWVNDSVVEMFGTGNWSNVTKTLNTTPKMIGWRIYANNTNSLMNDTGIQTVDIVRHQRVNLVSGWNLIAQLNQSSVNLMTLANYTAGVTHVRYWNATNQTLYNFTVDYDHGNYSVLVHYGEAFWINVTDDGLYSQLDSNITEEYTYVIGWNDIGLTENRSLGQINTSMGINVSAITNWNATSQKYESFAIGYHWNENISVNESHGFRAYMVYNDTWTRD